MIEPGSIVTIRAFDDIPEHTYGVEEVFDNCVTGHSLTGPLAGEYGEPNWSLIKTAVAGNFINPASH